MPTLGPVRIAVTGATGLIGSALVAGLRSSGEDVVRISRHATGSDIAWAPAEGKLDPHALDGVDAVVHLAGAGIADHRWTDDYKRTIRDSRLDATTLLARTIAGMDKPPAVLLSGSAIGDLRRPRRRSARRNRRLRATASSPRCASPGRPPRRRPRMPACGCAHLRSGVVLSGEGGALKKQLPLFKFGLGGRMGSGEQWSSWISIDDEVGAIVHLLSSDVSGAVNLTAPHPVTNAEFTDTLGTALHRPTMLPIPKFGPRLLLGAELAENLLFTGQRVVPNVLLADGYRFRHPDLADALQAAVA